MLFTIPQKKILFNDGEAVPTKVQILRVGNFSHPEYGKLSITKDILNTMVKNFNDKVRGVELSIDYAHNADKESAAWIKTLSLENDSNELWAEVEWTPVGKEKVSNKEFRYLSADFHFQYEDNEKKKSYGPTLFGAGLTNRPFVKHMHPIIFSEYQNENNQEKKKMENEDMKKENESLKKQLADIQLKMEADKKKAEEEKVLAEKKSTFDKMLSEGKVVEAQRDSYLANDFQKFVSLASNVNLSEQGHSATKKTTETEKKGDAQDKILKLAEEKVSSKKSANLSEAIKAVLSENKDLSAEYNKSQEF